MNKKPLIVTLAVIAGIFLFFSTPVPDMLFGLFFGGVIPGTDVTIPWSLMFVFYFVATIAVIFWARHRQLYVGSPKVTKAQAEFMAKNAPVKKKRATPKKKVVTTAAARTKKRTRNYSRA